jgi:3-oxoacyl-[acyl-carrier-protein] synthase-3
MATIVESLGVAVGGRWRGRSAHKLADEAATLALERAGLRAGEIDLLLNAGLYRDRNLGEPALAALIQEDIGANPEDPHGGGHGTFSFDVANGSCGMLTGLQVADGFLRAGTIRHALVVASDADPGSRLGRDFRFAPIGAAIVCSWRPGDEGIQGFRFAYRPDGTGDDRPDGGLRATVAFERGRNRLTIDELPGFAAAAGAWSAEVAGKLLADHGLAAGDIDLVVANPQATDFLDALATGLGIARGTLVTPSNGQLAHTAGLGVALEPVISRREHEGKTTLLVSAGARPGGGAPRQRGCRAADEPGSAPRLAPRGQQPRAEPARRVRRGAAEAGQGAGLGLDPQAVERHRQHLVVPDQEAQLHELALAELGSQRSPRAVGDHPPVVQLVCRRQEQPLAAVPAGGIGPLDHALEVGDPEAGALRQPDVLRPLVPGPAAPRGAEDDQLALGTRQVAAQQRRGERQPPPEQPAMAAQRGEHPGRLAAGGPRRHGRREPRRRTERTPRRGRHAHRRRRSALVRRGHA